MADESTPVNPAEAGTEVRTFFVRERNALLAQADFGELFVDYYLHLADHQLRPEPAHDELFKRALASFVLHSASRPWNEMTAWTINFQDPLVNLFLTGDNETGAVTGRVFDDNVRVLPENLFFADVIRGGRPKRRSSVSFSGADPFAAVEHFYAQSEQRGARYFQLAEERFALLSEHPDCDLQWFRNLTVEQVRALDEHETVVPMERRIQRWHCGCNQQRMLEVLAPVFKTGPEELFDGEETVEIRCPRCAARHMVTREALEAFVAKQ
jgi:molecular chaperone Hsp33